MRTLQDEMCILNEYELCKFSWDCLSGTKFILIYDPNTEAIPHFLHTVFLLIQPPVKNSPWTGIRDAMADSPTCIQADYLLQYNIHGQEDCLYLNVYTPKVSNF